MFGLDDVIGLGGAAMSVAGSVAQGLFSARQAAMNRDFQENMANSQIQRRVADAEAAGINPIFAVSGGSGAAAPSGAVASTPSLDPMVGIASAASAFRTYQEGRKAKAEADVTSAAVSAAKPALDLVSDPARLRGELTDLFESVAEKTSTGAKSAQSAFGRVQESVSDAVRRVEDYLRGSSESGGSVSRGGGSRAPTSAVDVERGYSSTLPGGAVVGRPVPGQLNILRLKRQSR